MDIGMIGLGKMGANMVTRLLRHDHRVVAFDLNESAVEKAVSGGAVGAHAIEDLVGQLEPPRVVWAMVPAGTPTEQTIKKLAELLSPGDVVVDGGNSNYKDSVRRASMLKDRGVHFIDVGTSGGVWGLAEGYSMMVGGEKEAISLLRPALETLAPANDRGWGHVGPSGAGHFVKMVHNGIEYGLMQAYAEGFDLLNHKREFDLDLHQIAEIWRHGSVVRSWLLDLTANALSENPTLDGIAPFVSDSGEGRWTVFEAIDLDVPAPVITLALLARLQSREDDSFTFKMLSAMRNQFGGHAVKKES
ncbi:MAG TPA: decarboxylating 6-phosphogluconate dehydrogenase [Rhodothermia bacterium]|nr:decarboxylating 6-phosphogluconate dehydrogenase [Rhodothermia bacterium]